MGPIKLGRDFTFLLPLYITGALYIFNLYMCICVGKAIIQCIQCIASHVQHVMCRRHNVIVSFEQNTFATIQYTTTSIILPDFAALKFAILHVNLFFYPTNSTKSHSSVTQMFPPRHVLKQNSHASIGLVWLTGNCKVLLPLQSTDSKQYQNCNAISA